LNNDKKFHHFTILLSKACSLSETFNQGCQIVYFQTKNPNLGILGGPWNVFVFYDHLEYLRPFGIIYGRLWSFGIFFPYWYIWTKKNLATLRSIHSAKTQVISQAM
jgi:hypothetical protein